MHLVTAATLLMLRESDFGGGLFAKDNTTPRSSKAMPPTCPPGRGRRCRWRTGLGTARPRPPSRISAVCPPLPASAVSIISGKTRRQHYASQPRTQRPSSPAKQDSGRRAQCGKNGSLILVLYALNQIKLTLTDTMGVMANAGYLSAYRSIWVGILSSYYLLMNQSTIHRSEEHSESPLNRAQAVMDRGGQFLTSSASESRGVGRCTSYLLKTLFSWYSTSPSLTLWCRQ